MRLPARISPRLLMGFGLMVLVCLAWLLGPLLGVHRPGLRFAVVLALLALGLLALHLGPAFGRILHRRRQTSRNSAPLQRELATRLDRILAAQAPSGPGYRARRRALSLLPWYLVIGDPGSGKSTALLESGLDFPLADQGAAPLAAPSGTCAWCLTPQAVYVDVPGAWMSGDGGRDHWLALLRLVRRRRPAPALQGILLCVPLPTLATSEAALLNRLASRLRQRLCEAEDLLHQTPPLHLLLTHLDRLEGSSPLIQPSQEHPGRQSWHLMRPWPPSNPPLDRDATLGTALDQLRQAMSGQLWSRGPLGAGGAVRKESSPPPAPAFLLAWDGLQEGLRGFLARLCEPHPGRRPLGFRGLHFISARQDGLPSRGVSQQISRRFLLSVPPPVPCAPSRSSQGLRTFFTETLPADRHLACRGWHPSPGRRAALLCSGLVLLGLSSAWGRSFLLNRRRITLAALEHRVTLSTLRGPNGTSSQLEALHHLQLRLEQLRRYRLEGAPWSLRWGLDPGPRLERHLRQAYDPGIRRLMLQPIQAALEAQLRAMLTPGTGGGSDHPQPTASGTYRDLKTYLMLSQRDRMDGAHIMDQFPAAWRPWLEAQAPEPRRSACRHWAERMLAFHLTRIGEPDIPILAADPDLVAAVRDRLAPDLRTLSPHERVYRSILARAAARFPALTLPRLMEGRDLDLFVSPREVPGVFSRAAWEGGIRESLESAARGPCSDGDWVMGSDLDANLTRHGDPSSNHARLLTLYKTDYAKAWQAFLQNLTLIPWPDPEASARSLARLSEPQHSPIGHLLARVARETDWDGPSPLDRTLDGIRQQMVRKTSTLLGSGAPETPASPSGVGELAGRFSALRQLAGNDSGQAALAPYYACLQKLQSRMAAVAAAPDPALAARQWCQSGPLGATELTEASLALERALPEASQETERTALRTFLLRPFHQVGPGVGPLAEQDLQRTWTQQVLPAWEGLASRYPFADSPQDATVPEILRVLHPSEGLLGQFIQGPLGPSVIRRGDSLASKSMGGQGPRLSPGALGAVSRMISATDKALRESLPSRFECQAVGTRGIREIVLEVDGQRLVYRNGVEAWVPFTWPGPVPGQGARLQVVSHDGTGLTLASFQGSLALIRMLELARQIPARDGATALEWSLRPEAPRSGAREDSARTLRILLRPSGGSNPLHFMLLRHQTLPPRLTP